MSEELQNASFLATLAVHIALNRSQSVLYDVMSVSFKENRLNKRPKIDPPDY